jgi:hypothetical protein
VDFISPSESDRFARLDPSHPVKAGGAVRAPLMRFSSPSTFKARRRGPRSPPHRSATSCSVTGLPDPLLPSSPFLTTSTACSAPNRPGISPGDARGVLDPSGMFPVYRDSPVAGFVSPHAVLAPVLPSQGLSPNRIARLQGLHRRPTVSANLRFPVGRGSIPLGYCLVGPRAAPHSGVASSA